MDRNILARENHMFFYVALTQKCLLTEEFARHRAKGARLAKYERDHPNSVRGHDAITQVPFRCSDGEFGYLRFTNEEALLLEEKGIDPLAISLKIPSCISGDVNDRCELDFGNGIKVSFKILHYEGDPGDGYKGIQDPVRECHVQVPLGRMVEMKITCS